MLCVTKPYDLTTTVVALRFNVSRQTVARWVTNGDLEALRLPGGHLRFNADDVNEFAATLAGATVTVDPDGAA